MGWLAHGLERDGDGSHVAGRTTKSIRFDDVAALQYVRYRKHGTEPPRVIHGGIDLLHDGRRLTVVNHDAVDAGGSGTPRHPHRTARRQRA